MTTRDSSRRSSQRKKVPSSLLGNGRKRVRKSLDEDEPEDDWETPDYVVGGGIVSK